MKNMRLGRYAFTICVAAALLAGCGALPLSLSNGQDDMQPPVGGPGVMPQSRTITTHAERVRSWMLPEAKRIKRLLYISEFGISDVYVYDYQTGDEVGELGGFDNPAGQCVDKKGDVYLTTEAGSEGSIVEYTHGGANPIKTLSAVGHPIGCSIDPTTGNLAVDEGLPGGASGIQVWNKASGAPAEYSSISACNEMWSPGYDNQGNLYVEGDEYARSVCELPARGNALESVSINRTINFPGSVMWDGKYITFTDQSYENETGLYRARRTRRGALAVVGITLLSDSCYGNQADVVQPFIVGKKNTPANKEESTAVVGANVAYYCSTEGRFDYWAYPAGGQPKRSLSLLGDQFESYEAVSIAP
jgi:hypothetical protein